MNDEYVRLGESSGRFSHLLVGTGRPETPANVVAPRTMPSQRDAVVIKLRGKLADAEKRIAELEAKNAELFAICNQLELTPEQEFDKAYGMLGAD